LSEPAITPGERVAQDKVLGLFPGMAAAAPGMGLPLVSSVAANATIAAFASLTGLDVAHLVCRAGEGELFAERAWEVAVVACEAAAAEAYAEQGGVLEGVLGFSIGAYAALHAAGAVTIDQIVTMIDIVLEASRRLPARYGMAAVTGVATEEVEAACAPGKAEVAATIVPGQLLVAGERRSVEALVRALAPRALRVQALAVPWPLHTSLMAPVAASLEAARYRVGELRPLRRRVYSALHGRAIGSPDEVWALVTQHLWRPQRLDAAILSARADGFRRCVELGPGSTVGRAVRWIAQREISVTSFPGAARGAGTREAAPC